VRRKPYIINPLQEVLKSERRRNHVFQKAFRDLEKGVKRKSCPLSRGF
jgi:hypothetical protein